jgi:hypothetical protein
VDSEWKHQEEVHPALHILPNTLRQVATQKHHSLQ